jgi:hypothetical protein
MDVIELGTGAGIIAAGALLLAYIRRVKNRLKRFVLRGGR